MKGSIPGNAFRNERTSPCAWTNISRHITKNGHEAGHDVLREQNTHLNRVEARGAGDYTGVRALHSDSLRCG